MTEIDAAALVARVEQLERRLCRLRRMIGGAMLAGLIAVAVVLSFGGRVLADTEHSGIVKARAFEVVDANGVVRAALGLSKVIHPTSGTASGVTLDLYSPIGETEAVLSAGMGAAAFTLNAPGTGSAIVAQTALLTGIYISGAKNEGSVYLGITPRGTGLDVQSTQSGVVRLPGAWGAFLGIGPDHTANLELDSNYDFYTGRRLVLGATKLQSRTGSVRTPESSITAFDKKGNVIARWPSP